MDSAEAVAEKIRQNLKTQGWCFLSCEFLEGDTVVLVRDKPSLRDFEREQLGRQADKVREKSGSVDNIVCYTLSEFMILLDATSPRLLHQAKKMGATIEV